MNKKDIIKLLESEEFKNFIKNINKIKKIDTGDEFPLDVEKYINFNDIPNKELEEQYEDLRWIASNVGYNGGKIMYDNANNSFIISESNKGITIPAEEACATIKKTFKFKKWQLKIETFANNVNVIAIIPNLEKNVELVKKAMETLGWYYATSGIRIHNGKEWYAISFDPMYQNNVNEEVRQCKYLYHLTPKYLYMGGISKNGLIPKSENSKLKYPKRVHLLRENIPPVELLNIGNLLSKNNLSEFNDGLYILLKIDLSKVPETVDFYYDPRYDWGYYTNQNIPAEAITAIDEIYFN